MGSPSVVKGIGVTGAGTPMLISGPAVSQQTFGCPDVSIIWAPRVIEPVWNNLFTQLENMTGVSVYRFPAKPNEILAIGSKPTPCIVVRHVEDALAADDENWTNGFAAAHTEMLGLAEREDLDVCRRVVKLGWKGVLLPDLTAPMLSRAIATVIRGELWMSRAAVSAIVQEFSSADVGHKLTPRERDILRLLAQGCKNQQIANALFISRDTVRWHIRSLYSKLGMHNRKSAEAYAATLRWPPEAI